MPNTRPCGHRGARTRAGHQCPKLGRDRHTAASASASASVVMRKGRGRQAIRPIWRRRCRTGSGVPSVCSTAVRWVSSRRYPWVPSDSPKKCCVRAIRSSLRTEIGLLSGRNRTWRRPIRGTFSPPNFGWWAQCRRSLKSSPWVLTVSSGQCNGVAVVTS